MHEEFQQLCALSAVGRLSAVEMRQLEQHLSGCTSCRVLRNDYAALLTLLPCPENSLSSEAMSALQEASYRERFLATARAEGIDFSNEVRQRRRPGGWRQWEMPWSRWLSAAAAVACMVIVVAASWGVRRGKTAPNSPVAAAGSHAPTVHAASSVATPAPTVAQPTPGAKAERDTYPAEMVRLRAELQAATARANRLEQELALQSGKSSQLENKSQRLAEDAQAANAKASDLQQQIESLSGRKQELESSLTSSQANLVEMATKLRDASLASERERELSAAARDVRTLMGARNLHITDVFDVDGHGALSRSFGRVFYTEGQSLIFYAFDLPDSRNGTRKVSFQAWGQREGKGALAARSLGVFVIDDREQHRWVLRVNAPQLVSGIDSVFVTVEPMGGADKPTGRRMMYAYLGDQANHP